MSTVFAVLLSTLAASAAPPIPVPPAIATGVVLQVFVTGCDQPVGATFAPGDPGRRLFVIEKTGRIRVVKGGRLLVEPFVDLSSRVSRASEQGLLGLAFHGEFTKNGRLFVNFTDRDGDTRILELTVEDPLADRAKVTRERALLRVDQPYANHNGGHLLMGRDGKLLIGLGDGGSGGDPKGNAQNKRSLLGKMFKLDPDGSADEAQPAVLARGLRNPWRYAIDRASGDLYIADVGQDRWEEIDVVPLDRLDGANFGWNMMEGSHCFGGAACASDGLILPVLEYGHDSGCSITGGVVYRGRALSSLSGLYFYSDYCTAILRSFRWKRDAGTAVDHWDWKAALDPKSRLAEISAFGEDEDGEVYVVSLRGTIWKLAPVSSSRNRANEQLVDRDQVQELRSWRLVRIDDPDRHGTGESGE